MQNPQNNKLLLEMLDEYVTGHLAAKKALIVMLNRSRLRTYQKYEKYMDDSFLATPLKILLLAASGTGKTHLVNSLQKIARFPLVKVDATHLNPTGASGGVKPEQLAKMIKDEAHHMCIEHPLIYPYLEYAIEQTVVYVDEVDKLGTSFEGSGNWNRHIQSSFLTLFDNKDEFSGVSFIFSGAFEVALRTEKVKNLGFNPCKESTEVVHIEDKIVQSGLIPEIVGRMNAIIQLDVFTKADYLGILEKRILPKKIMDLAAMGIFDAGMKKKEKELLAEKASKSGQGVRFLQREVDKIFMDIEFDYDNVPMLGEI